MLKGWLIVKSAGAPREYRGLVSSSYVAHNHLQFQLHGYFMSSLDLHEHIWYMAGVDLYAGEDAYTHKIKQTLQKYLQ